MNVYKKLFKTRGLNPSGVDTEHMSVGSISINLIFTQMEGTDVRCEPQLEYFSSLVIFIEFSPFI